jgi:V/A-type H+-transporting ATPase subunit E
MATISISGTNKLAERIISEAEADAQKMRAAAEDTARSIRSESEKAVSSKRSDLESKREAEKQSLLDGFKTRTELDGRKNVLSKKRAVIDDVFSRAYQAVLALDETSRTKICETMLRNEAEGGETVVPAKADRKGIAAALAGLGERKLKLSEKDAQIEGGFLLVSESYEKDCSFSSLMDAVRSDEETNVAKMLFD